MIYFVSLWGAITQFIAPCFYIFKKKKKKKKTRIGGEVRFIFWSLNYVTTIRHNSCKQLVSFGLP
jgi:hypothetical protein